MAHKENPTPHTCPAYSCGHPAYVSYMNVMCSNVLCKYADMRAIRERSRYEREQALLDIQDDEGVTSPGFVYDFWKVDS